MHKLDWEPAGVCWLYNGDVTGKEIIEASKKVYGDPRFDRLTYKLVDFLDVESIQIDEREVAIIASQHKAAATTKPHIKNAIVIHDSARKMADLFASFLAGSSWEVKIFQDREEANEWVGRTAFNSI